MRLRRTWRCRTNSPRHWRRTARPSAFFDQLDKTNRYAVCWRVHTAKKPETRAARVEKLVAMLAKGEKIHG